MGFISTVPGRALRRYQQRESMLRTLEDKVSIPGPVTRVAQSSETKRMSSVVSQVETGVSAQVRLLVVFYLNQPTIDQSLNFVISCRAFLQTTCFDEVVEIFSRHQRNRSNQ